MNHLGHVRVMDNREVRSFTPEKLASIGCPCVPEYSAPLIAGFDREVRDPECDREVLSSPERG